MKDSPKCNIDCKYIFENISKFMNKVFLEHVSLFLGYSLALKVRALSGWQLCSDYLRSVQQRKAEGNSLFSFFGHIKV